MKCHIQPEFGRTLRTDFGCVIVSSNQPAVGLLQRGKPQVECWCIQITQIPDARSDTATWCPWPGTTLLTHSPPLPVHPRPAEQLWRHLSFYCCKGSAFKQSRLKMSEHISTSWLVKRTSPGVFHTRGGSAWNQLSRTTLVLFWSPAYFSTELH